MLRFCDDLRAVAYIATSGRHELGSHVRGRNRWSRAAIRVMASAAIAASVVAPGPSAAQEPSAEQQRDAVRDQAVAVAAEIDVLGAQDAEIQAVLADLQVQVAGQQVVVAQATDAQASADAAVAASAEQIAAVEAETVALNAAIDQMIVDAYLHPPMDHALDAFKADTVSDAAFKNGIVDIQSAEDAATLTRLGEAEDELTVQKAQQEGLAAEAAQAKGEADAAMADLDTVVAAQNQLATEVQSRLDAKNAEAVALAASDAALSQQIQAEQAALAAALSSSRQTGLGASPGGLATVSCPSGGSITVAGSIAGDLQALLDASSADGVQLCGGGYRDPSAQIALRREHCGTSDYAIYEMPSSQCSPPTARPGSSMHEQGLAVDFTCNGGGTVSSGSACFRWLSANAASYGLYNLPSEPWHWSTNGN